MDKPRWEILVLAAAILVGALAIASSMRANRYAFLDTGSIGDTQTGEFYKLVRPSQAAEWTNTPKEKRATWIMVGEPVK